jgi:hypothetical protein
MASGRFIRLGVIVLLSFTLYGAMSGSAYADVDESARDEFAAISYSGSDGTISWTGAWSEIGESDGPSSGIIDVVNSSRCAVANCLRFGGDAADIDGHGVWREVDLSGALSAQLTFRLRREPMGPTPGAVAVAISGNGGGSWSTLATYDFFGNANQIDASFDVAAYGGPNTRIRFLCGGTGVSGHIYVDDIEITAWFLDPASTTTTSRPPEPTTTTTTQAPEPTTTTTTQAPEPTTTTTTQAPEPTTTTTTQAPVPTTVAGDTGPPDARNSVAGSLSPIQGLTVAFDTAVEALTGIAFPAIALGILTAGLTVAGLERRRDRTS